MENVAWENPQLTAHLATIAFTKMKAGQIGTIIKFFKYLQIILKMKTILKMFIHNGRSAFVFVIFIQSN